MKPPFEYKGREVANFPKEIEDAKEKWRRLVASGAYDRIFIFSGNLLKKYPDAQKYALFHVLGGSTLGSPNEYLYTDFPGDDSIAKFLERLIKEYNPS